MGIDRGAQCKYASVAYFDVAVAASSWFWLAVCRDSLYIAAGSGAQGGAPELFTQERFILAIRNHVLKRREWLAWLSLPVYTKDTGLNHV